jgi:dCMP deaminase
MAVQLLAFVPVIHRGYEQVISRLGPRSEVLLLGESFAEEHPVIRKEIRALPPERVAQYLTAVYPDLAVGVVETSDIADRVRGPLLIVPDEKLMRSVVRKHRLNRLVDKVQYEPTFLRWDRSWAELSEPAERLARPAGEEDAVRLARAAVRLSDRSGDWWRQVGAMAVRDGKVLAKAENQHLPSEYSPYVSGDPRNEYRKGLRTDLTTALHAEAAVVAEAAAKGIRLTGADIFVSTFPCPSCARLIAAAGIARCFFASGYSSVGAAEVLEAAGVELLYVDVTDGGRGQMALPDALA